MNRNKLWVWVPTVLAIVLMVLAPLFLNSRPYIMHIAIVAFFYAILASSWSLLAGYGGQFSFAHMAFMAIGAYTTGLFAKFVRITTVPTHVCTEMSVGPYTLFLLNPVPEGEPNCLQIAKATMPVGTLIYRPPVYVGILLGILMGAVFGLLVGVLVLRLRRTYLALFTIGFSEIVRVALNAEISITNGPNGLELPPLFPQGITILGHTFGPENKLPPYYVMLLLFLVSMAIMYWVAASRFGLFIRSIREDEEAASALGVNIVRYKVLLFILTSMIAAAAGAVEAHYIGVITPNILLILQMSLVIAMAVIGGLESLAGAAIGAILIEFALEFLRQNFTIGPVTIDMTVWRLVFFGVLLMLTLRFQNNGLIYPLIQRLSRAGVAEEVVAKRLVPQEAVQEVEG